MPTLTLSIRKDLFFQGIEFPYNINGSHFRDFDFFVKKAGTSTVLRKSPLLSEGEHWILL